MKSNLTNRSKVTVSMLTIFSMALSLVGFVPQASAAFVPGGSAGPRVAAGIGRSLPAWFMDQNGLALEVMESADGFGISFPPEVGNAFSQELGFSDEGFYWTSDSIMTNPAGPRGLTVLALEVAYLGGTVEGGESIFGRIRHRYDVDIPGTYTIRHPFGTQTFVVDTILPGSPEINDSSDIGCTGLPGVAVCDPILALNSGIGPFLTWDTFNVDFDPVLAGVQPDPSLINAANPTKRYIGNPNVPHAVTGSPVGQNFVRVEGPAGSFAGAGFIQQNLFTVTGRVAVVDTVAPVVTNTVTTAAPGSTNVVLRSNVTDDLGVRNVTIDMSSLGSTFGANLTGAQEVGTLGSSATGAGTFTIDTVANTLAFNINFSGLPAGDVETTPHIHNAAAGANGPVVFDLPAGAAKTGTWTYPENLEAEILAGRTYVQIHSVLFPAGAIRGQIIPTPNKQNMILTAGTATSGTWSLVVPSVTRLGSFTLPVSASDGSNTGTGAVTLNVTALTSVSITPATATIIGTASTTLTAAPLDNNGAPFAGATVTWSSSNQAAATVDASGVVTGVAPGSTVITATAVSGATTVTGTSSVTVLSAAPVFSSVAVTPAASTITLNSTVLTKQLTASALNQFGSALVPQPAFAWTSSAPSVATVDPTTGLVTAVATGTATITAQATVGLDTFSGSATVTVVTEPQVLTSLSLTPIASVVRGATSQLAATGLDQFGGAMAPQPAITFTSSNPAVATVDAAGLVTGVATGTATITAQSGALSATSAVTVTAAPQVLSSIAVTPSPASVLVSGTRQLAASGKDQFGDPMVPQPAFIWSSSNPLVVAVDANGLLTAGTATGTAVITASSGAVSTTTTANVVTDATAPVISVIGGDVNITVGTPYTDAGATALDAVDGTVAVTSTSTVNTSVAGNYTVTYTATDAAGNVATAVRNVVISAPAAGGGGGGGGGGGAFTPSTPSEVTAINVSLTVTQNQAGKLTNKFADGSQVEVKVPNGAVSAPITFNVAQSAAVATAPTGAVMIGDKVFNVTAKDASGAAVTNFGALLQISIAPAALPADISNVSVFVLNEVTKQWTRVTGVIFDPVKGEFKFHVDHLSTFALIRTTADSVTTPVTQQPPKQVLGVKIFDDGVLIRAKNKKIFVITNGQKRHVANLIELRKHAGKKIVEVDDTTLQKISDFTGKVLGIKLFEDGTLIRTKDGKIFVISKGTRKPIASLAELKNKHRGKKINNISNDELKSIPLVR